MTNVEAIETLRANYPDAYYGQLREAVDAAIEALKEQNVSDTNVGDNGNNRMKMDDTISRQDAINAANDWLLDCLKVQKQGRSCGLIRRLEDLPSAQPEQQWILCSEMLPEVDELVLVTDDSGRIKTVDVDRCGQYEDSNKRFWYCTQNAVAWMPLPKPY